MRTKGRAEKISRRRNKGNRFTTAAAAAACGALALVFLPVPAVFPGNTAFTAAAASGQESGQEENVQEENGKSSAEKVTLRIANWEEYIDEGDWDEEEAIDLDDENSTVILGENSMIEDFEEWYRETYGTEVEVEYSTFGTNEDMYNQLTLGNEFDLVCPSEYMFMKLIAEDRLHPLSEGFFDEKTEENYYIRGISDYIRNIFDTNTINGEPWSKYAAGYMWGVTGIVYNPEEISKEEASRCAVLTNPKYKGQITIKLPP